MPLHYHPLLRDHEKALESVGVIQKLDSVGYTVQKAAEAAGTQPKPAIAVGTGWWFLGANQADVS